MTLTLYKFGYGIKKAFAIFYIASTMGLLANILIPDPKLNDSGGTTVLFIAAWLLLYLCTLFFLLLSPGALLKKFNVFIIIFFFLVLSGIISTVWSHDRINTLSYSGVLILNFLFCMWLVNEFELSDIVSIIFQSILIMVLGSLFFYALGYGGVLYFDPHGRDTLLGTQPLRGFFNHKITAGLYSVFGFLLCISLKRGFSRLAFSSLFILFILLTGSSAAVGLLLIGFVVFIFIKSMLYYRFSLGVFISIMLLVPLSAILIFIFLGAEILAALGRDPTLTGRTQLWGWGVDVALQKPWLGWGYQAYMGSEHAKAYALTIPRFVNYDVPHFHNAYIQILVELGFLGFLLYFITYMVVVGKLYTLSACRYCIGLFPLLTILTLLLISSFFINTFFQYNDFSTMLFFISAIVVSGNYTVIRSRTEG